MSLAEIQVQVTRLTPEEQRQLAAFLKLEALKHDAVRQAGLLARLQRMKAGDEIPETQVRQELATSSGS